jgi:hypothetical protein
VLKGSDAERRYQERAPAYFRPIVLRAHVLSADERAALVEGAVERRQLSHGEADDLLLADVLARGRHRDDHREVYLVAEVSWGIGFGDVERAARRANLLGRTGLEVVAVVAGERIDPEVQVRAHSAGVWQVTDGRAIPPEGSTG